MDAHLSWLDFDLNLLQSLSLRMSKVVGFFLKGCQAEALVLLAWPASRVRLKHQIKYA